MKDVNVTDVDTLDMFASSLDRFSLSYASALRLVSSAADEDIARSGNIISLIQRKLEEAIAQQERARRELDSYCDNCRREERTPDSSVISALKSEIEEAGRRIDHIRRVLMEAEIMHGEITHQAHQADSLMSYAFGIEDLCDETSKATRNAADCIRKYS